MSRLLVASTRGKTSAAVAHMVVAESTVDAVSRCLHVERVTWSSYRCDPYFHPHEPHPNPDIILYSRANEIQIQTKL